MYVAEAFAPHTDRASSRVLSSQITMSDLRYVPSTWSLGLHFFFSTVNHSSKGKSKTKRGNERKGTSARTWTWREMRNRNSHFFLPSSRELYNLRYVTSPSKIHFTIHTNIYNRYINNMADNYGETAPDIRLNWIFPIKQI